MSFTHHAAKAARAERQGRFSRAYRHWMDAARTAKKSTNQHWAEGRAEHCLKASGYSGGAYVKVNRPAI